MDQTPPQGLLIVWWSVTGGSEALARAAFEGALRSRATTVRLLAAPDVEAADLVTAAGLLFVTPEMLGSMAGRMKEFFERTYYSLLDRIAGRPCALIVCAGSDGTGAARQVERIVTGWRLRWIDAPMIVVTGAQTPEAIGAPKRIDGPALARASSLGEAMAEGLAMGLW
jgi:multimeric flavodoxin WrbA